jgi:threonine aldolase
MREAIARAEVGDDMFSDDPTIHALEAEVAAIVGTEAALFVTSGTMGNQLAIAVHTRPGDEVIVGDGAHIIVMESGAGAVLSGVQFAVAGKGGLFDADEMEARIITPGYWSPRTSLVCVENTHNRAGGRIFPQRDAIAVAERARKHDLKVHLDGARIWNASVATGLSPKELAAPFDTVSVCFSKGLGAPVGSALCASRENVDRARRFRKMWGGAMRQAGVLGAAALHALRNHRDRIPADHVSAKAFAERLSRAPGAHVDLAGVETNIVNVDLDAPLTGEAVCAAARTLGLLINPSGPRRVRAVTHFDAPLADVERGADLLAQAIAKAKAG